MNTEVYYQPILTDEEWNNNRDFNTTDVFREYANAKTRFPNNQIGAYSGKDIDLDNINFVDSEIFLICSKCFHIEHYECEEHLFQGEMFGLENDVIVCPKCIN